jgi:mannosyltransferase OCH1-like enzyme
MVTIINFIWMGNKLTDIGLLSLKSFDRLGYTCVLWSYNTIENVPEYVIQKDANYISPLPDKRFTTVLFSDYLRYKLLHKDGGIYSDLDNILLKELVLKMFLELDKC